MDTVKLSQLLRAATYIVEVYEGEEKISAGSAFCVAENGGLVTAAHVVTGRTPIRTSDWQDPSISIIARTSQGSFAQYRTPLCGVQVVFPGPLKEPLQIDLAVLSPIEPQSGVPYLNINYGLVPVGTQVLMAGFPDELELPLGWDKAVNFDFDAIRQSAVQTRRHVDRARQLLMVKSGMIGHANDLLIDPDGSGSRQLLLGIYYVDNVMHSGASGGPVINMEGQVVGVITKRAVTKVSYPDLPNPNKEVPSGSALAITPFTILKFIEQQIADGKFKKST